MNCSSGRFVSVLDFQTVRSGFVCFILIPFDFSGFVEGLQHVTPHRALPIFSWKGLQKVFFRRPENGRSAEAREDADLLKLALSQMWPIDQEMKEEILARQLEIVKDPLVPSFVRVTAAKNVVAMGIMNLKVIDTVLKLRSTSSGLVQLDQVMQLWKGALEAIRANVTDQALLRAITNDVLRLIPPPSREAIEGQVEKLSESSASGNGVQR